MIEDNIMIEENTLEEMDDLGIEPLPPEMMDEEPCDDEEERKSAF